MEKEKFLSWLHLGLDKFIDGRNKSENIYDWIDDDQEKILDEFYDFCEKNLKDKTKPQKESEG